MRAKDLALEVEHLRGQMAHLERERDTIEGQLRRLHNSNVALNGELDRTASRLQTVRSDVKSMMS